MVACTTLPKRPRCNEKSYGWVARLCSNVHRRRSSWPNCLGCRGHSRHRNNIQVGWRDCWFSRNVHSGFRVRKATQSLSLHRMRSSNSTKQSKEQCPHSIPRPLTLRSSGTVLRRVASRRSLTSNVRCRMTAPKYRWSCHRCHEANEPGVAVCANCGFSASARAVDLEGATSSSPEPTTKKTNKTGLTGICPKCRTSVVIPGGVFSVRAFSCPNCGSNLVSNHPVLYVIALVLWLPLVIWSYQRWPTFTFLIGDWLLLVAVGLAIFTPFHRLSVVASDESAT